MSDHDAFTALNLFTGCCGRFALQRIDRVGFSGSTVWKVSAADRSLLERFPAPLCLKRWSADHPPPARLPWIHQVQNEARHAGLEFVPQAIVSRAGSTCCEFAGSTWELMTWQPGTADANHPCSARRMAAASRALAMFHEATKSTASSAPAPAFLDRWQRWEELQSGALEKISAAVQQRHIPVIDDLAQAWLTQHSQLDFGLARRLESVTRIHWPLQPAIRDLWRDHVLYLGDDVTGFIDLGAMRIDTHLTDLARLIGSLAGDNLDLRQAACTAYSTVRPLSARDIELIDLLDHSGTLLAGWNWLDWLYVQQRQFPSLAAVRDRLRELLYRKLPLLGTPGRGLG